MSIKYFSTLFLKFIAFLMGIVVLAVCIYWLPNAAKGEVLEHPGDYSVYPLLACLYVVCIMFLVALYQVFKLLTYVEKNNVFSELSLHSLQLIKICAFTIIFFILFVIVYLRVLAQFTGDDPAGPISLGLIGILATSLVIAFVNVLQKPLKIFLDEQSKNN